MKPNSQFLLIKLERELDHIHIEHSAPTSYCEHALKLLHTKIEQLENHLAGHSFPTKEEEVNFLDSIKPWITSRLLYYQTVFSIEHHKPCGSGKILRYYYKSALEKLKRSPDQRLDFYHNYHIKNIHKDNKQFNTDANEFKLAPDALHDSDYGQKLLTPDDFKAAKIPVSDLIRLYLEYELAKLDAGPIPGQTPRNKLIDKMNKDDTS